VDLILLVLKNKIDHYVFEERVLNCWPIPVSALFNVKFLEEIFAKID
jgi:hypothetical protein